MFQEDAEKILLKEAGDDRFLKMMAEQTIEIMRETKNTGEVGEEGRSLKGLKEIFDKFASENKQGNSAVILPNEAAEMIKDYFNICNQSVPANIDVLSLF